MIKRLLNGQINSINLAALVIALSSLASRFLGVYRDRILAGRFGAGDELDIYYAAFRVPDMIFNLLVLGALSAGFIPIFTGLIKDYAGKKELAGDNAAAWKLASNVLNIVTFLLIALSLLGAVFAPWLIKFIASGFDPEKQAATVLLTRIMFLSPIFLGISGVLGGILQSFKRFLVYSLSPILYNLGIIFGAIFLVPRFGLAGLAWGVVIGAFFHMAVQLPAVFGLGYRYRAGEFDFKDKNVLKIGTMMVPRTLSLAVAQINLVVITIFASGLSSGALAVFNFANNLQSFPIGIFGISYAIAAFPAMSAVAFDKEKLIGSVSATLRQILFFVIPATVLLLTLRAQIIRVILGTGNFNWDDTMLTMDALGYFAVSLFAQAVTPLFVRAFYARHDSKTPFLIGLASAALNIILSYWLVRENGVSGLALAFSISNIFNLLLLWVALIWELGSLDDNRVFLSVIKFSAAAMFSGASIQVMKLLIWPYIDMTKFWGIAVQGALSGLVGLFVYFLVCAILRSEEFYGFWSSIKRRLPWGRTRVEGTGEARGI